MPVPGYTGLCSEHPEIIVKAVSALEHPSLSTWYLPVGREELKHISLPPDLGPSKDKGVKPPCLASSQSLPQWHAKRSFRFYAYREGDSHSIP